MPASAAPRAKAMVSSGVRWADSTRTSATIPKDRRVWTASSMIDESDELPMMMATDMGAFCPTVAFWSYRPVRRAPTPRHLAPCVGGLDRWGSGDPLLLRSGPRLRVPVRPARETGPARSRNRQVASHHQLNSHHQLKRG